MSLTITNPSFDKVYTMYAWRDNNIRLVLTQGEGLITLDGTVAHVKAPKFQLRDERGVIDLTSCTVSLALTRPDGSEDLLACSSESGEAAQGIVSCPITASATAIAGQATGEIRVDSTNGVVKFYGVHAIIYKGVSDAAAAQSTQFSALIAALQKVALITPDPESEDTYTIRLDDAIAENGTNPVASGVIYDYLVDNYYTKAQSDASARSIADDILSGEDDDASIELINGELVYYSIDGTVVTLGDAKDVFYTKSQMDKVILWGTKGIVPQVEYNAHNERVASYFDDNPADYTDYSSEGGNTPYTVSYIPSPSGENAVQRSEHADKPNTTTITNLPNTTSKIIVRDVVTGKEWTDTASGTSYVVKNLIPNHIYALIAQSSANALLKIVSCLATGKVRMIDVGSSTETTDPYNIRDIGGWTCDGGMIRYGILFRGSELDDGVTLTSSQKSILTNVLGIQEEIDLRETASVSPALGVSYFHKSVRYYINSINVASRLADTISVIKRIAKNIGEQKPTYIHCQAGADRTATVLMFIEAICGMSQSDIDRDYELTSFSYRYNGDQSAWEYNDRRRKNGTFGGGYANWKNFMEAIKTLNNEATFNAKIIRFLMENGVSADEINAIRIGLIDGTPAEIAPLGAATITTSLSGVLIDNTAQSVEFGQPYNANLLAHNMRQFTTVSITMGGTDITSSCFTNGKINIPNVTGNIVITATAVDVSTQVASLTIPSSGWNNGECVIDALMPVGVSAISKVDVNFSETVFNQLLADGCTGLYVATDTVSTPTFTLHAMGNAPTSNITIQLLIQRLASA